MDQTDMLEYSAETMSRSAAGSAGAVRVPDPGAAAQPDGPSHDEIARLAYSYWEQRGGEGGSPDEDWRRAEEELRAARRPS